MRPEYHEAKAEASKCEAEAEAKPEAKKSCEAEANIYEATRPVTTMHLHSTITKI